MSLLGAKTEIPAKAHSAAFQRRDTGSQNRNPGLPADNRKGALPSLTLVGNILTSDGKNMLTAVNGGGLGPNNGVAVTMGLPLALLLPPKRTALDGLKRSGQGFIEGGKCQRQVVLEDWKFNRWTARHSPGAPAMLPTAEDLGS